MNAKEISEIRRRFRPERSCIERVRGCCVNENKAIISEFNQSMGLLSQDESEKLLALLKKTLCGGLDKNLFNIEFSSRQVLEGEEHKLLMALRSSALSDEVAVHAFYSRVIESVSLEGNYLILLACDRYDVPAFSKDGARREESSGVFSYIVCGICPLKPAKAALGYFAHENCLKSTSGDLIVAPPELGFMFPAFTDRAANIYSALYYSRNTARHQEALIEAVFRSKIAMPAGVQKETFQAVLGEAVADDCSIEVVKAVFACLAELVEAHKAERAEEPLFITRGTVREVLASCGVEEERIRVFEERFDAEFGPGAELNPQNIIDMKKFELVTPDATVRINPERRDLLETRVLGGVKYILIRADQGAEVNGLNIKIS